MCTKLVSSALSSVGLVLASASLPAATLQLLGRYNADGYDYAVGLADDGTVIGNSQDFESSAPVVWSTSGSAYSGAQAVALPAGTLGGEVRWVSPDASLLAGLAAKPLTVDDEFDQVPVIWSRSSSGAYVATALPRLGGGASETLLTGGSSSGTRFVGQSGATPSATVWRGSPVGGYTAQALILPSGAVGASLSTSISANGARAVGYYETASGTQAVVWTESANTYAVAKLQGLSGGTQSFAQVVSRDGTLAAGAADNADGLRPVTWNTGTGAVTTLETLPGFEATVLAISDNKLWLGGRATDSETFDSSAVLWNSTGQIFDLVALASSAGTSFAGITPESVTGVHFVSNGLYTIVGTGITADGGTQGFVLENLLLDLAPIPEPDTTAVIVGAGALAGVFLKRRQRSTEPAPVFAPWSQSEESARTLGATGTRPRSR